MFFNNLHSAKLAQKSNLTYYEEAEDSDKVDNLGEKKKEELGAIECEEMPENSLIVKKHASSEDIISEETEASDAESRTVTFMGQKISYLAWRTELWKAFSDDEIEIIEDRMDDVESEAAFIVGCMEN